jgi:myo-inositol-1(or 4)-monophosphatase
VANEHGTAPDAAELLDLAVATARAAADLAREHRAEGVAGIGTKSTITDLVTEADRAVERFIVRQIRQHRPHDAFLGEEYGEDSEPTSERGRSEAEAKPDGHSGSEATVRWVVDPIDGTVNYVYGLPVYAVSIAAQVGGQSVAGVVVNAPTGEEWTATRGHGAWRDGRRLHTGSQTDLGQALVATGFAYDAAVRARQAAVVAGVLPRVRDIRRFGAASVDLCYTAEGQFDAFYERGLNPWDHAAAGLVAVEAGLLVTGLRGAPPSGDMVLAAPPALHGLLHDLLVALDA